MQRDRDMDIILQAPSYSTSPTNFPPSHSCSQLSTLFLPFLFSFPLTYASPTVMHPVEFCESYIMASLTLVFISNTTLALLLGIPYSEERHERILDVDQPTFRQGELVQIVTSSVIVVIIFFLFLCRIGAIPYFRVSKVIACATLAVLSVLGTCYLTTTTLGGGNDYCVFNDSRNSKKCYRQPYVELPLSWFSTSVILTTVVVSFISRTYDGAGHTWPRRSGDGPRATRRDSLDLVRMQRSSSGNDAGERQEGILVYCPPPPCRSSTTPYTSYVLPSIPLRKRDMNKLGLTVVTNMISVRISSTQSQTGESI